jgi:hypothetical protein
MGTVSGPKRWLYILLILLSQSKLNQAVKSPNESPEPTAASPTAYGGCRRLGGLRLRRGAFLDGCGSAFHWASSSTMKTVTAKVLFVACMVFAYGSPSGQTNVWQPSPGHTQLPIWPGGVPDAHAQRVPGPEYGWVNRLRLPGGRFRST